MLIVERCNDVPCLQKIDYCFGQGCHHALYCLAVKCYKNRWKEKYDNRILTKEEYHSYRKLQFIKEHGYRIGRSLYTVRAKDTIESICSKFGISICELRTLNNRKVRAVSPGNKLRVCE